MSSLFGYLVIFFVSLQKITIKPITVKKYLDLILQFKNTIFSIITLFHMNWVGYGR